VSICKVPPAGWYCTRAAGHEGPCAAIATSDHVGILASKLEALLSKATAGPWEIDTERNEDGEYGGGPNPGRGYDDFLIGADVRGKWATLLSTSYADEKEIDEDYDEDYHRAWDRIGEANVTLVVEVVNALPLLLAELRRLRTLETVTAAEAAGGDDHGR